LLRTNDKMTSSNSINALKDEKCSCAAIRNKFHGLINTKMTIDNSYKLHIIYIYRATSGVAKGGHRCMSHRRTWKIAFVSGFSGLCPQTATRALPLDPAAGLLSPRPNLVPYSKFLATPLSATQRECQHEWRDLLSTDAITVSHQ